MIKNMPKTTIVALFCLIGIIIIVGFLIWQFWPNSVAPSLTDETADWKTYTNQEYGFEIKYPLDWQIVSGTSSAYVEFSKDDKEQPEFILPGDKKVPANYEIRVDIDNISNVKDYSDAKKVVIAGKNGLQWEEGAAPSSGPATLTEIGNNNKFYIISYSASANEDTHKKFIDIYDKMLSTFKFINQ